MNNEQRDFLKTDCQAVAATASPASTPLSDGQTAARPSIPGQKMMLNGIRYHVGEQGNGDKVALVLHGMPDTSSVWRFLVPALVEAGYRVIVPDMLGYGETEKPQDPQRYGLESIVGDMIALLDALSLKQVDLIGHDWGAATSWELVLNFPERFRRYAALSIGHPDQMMFMNSIADVKDSWYMYLPTQQAAGALYAANDGAFFKKFIMPSHPEAEEVWSRLKDPEAMLGNLNWDRGNPMASAYLAALGSAAAPRKCSVPTLGLWSTGDVYVWESQVELSSNFMSAPWRYARIEGASHWMMLDRAQEVNALLLDWFENA